MSRPAVLVFAAKGCGACEDFVPRLMHASRSHRARGMPVFVADIAADPSAAKLAERYRIRATPTTLVRTRGGAVHRRIGSLGDAAIAQLLDWAVR